MAATSPSAQNLQREQVQAMQSTMHEVMPKLWLGGVLAAENVEDLLSKKICFVMTLKTKPTRKSVRHAYEQNRIEHIRFSIDDDAQQDILSIFPDTCKKIEEQLQKGNIILVHCHLGMSRSAAVVTAYVMQRWGVSRDSALAYVRDKRNAANPNQGFRRQLTTWETTLRADIAKGLEPLCFGSKADNSEVDQPQRLFNAARWPKFDLSPAEDLSRDPETARSKAGAEAEGLTTISAKEGSAEGAPKEGLANADLTADGSPVEARIRSLVAETTTAAVPVRAQGAEVPVAETLAEVFRRWDSRY